MPLMRNALLVHSLLLASLVATAGAAWAERADRGKPLTIEADSPSKLDIPKQVVTFNGNVVVAKGTMSIRADRVEVRETPDGFHVAIATGKPATFRQKRDGGGDEWIEGRAERLEYDSRADTIRFSGAAQVRRLRGGSVADEISGAQISYDNAAEVFSVTGGAVTADNPNGRVRAVLTPRGAAAADAPASAPADAKPPEPRG